MMRHGCKWERRGSLEGRLRRSKMAAAAFAAPREVRRDEGVTWYDAAKRGTEKSGPDPCVKLSLLSAEEEMKQATRNKLHATYHRDGA